MMGVTFGGNRQKLDIVSDSVPFIPVTELKLITVLPPLGVAVIRFHLTIHIKHTTGDPAPGSPVVTMVRISPLYGGCCYRWFNMNL
jgi:hypothetical protein